ncbi:MAG: hypothetical protein KAR42_08575 [candidate division Zixibacteria bacterium]|nr:hypothetical protein [candidate division Zixibacteria bacterium]
MLKKTLILLAVLILIGLMSTAQAQTNRRTVSVIFEKPDTKFNDFTLLDKLYDRLLLQVGLQVIVLEDDSTIPKMPDNRFNLERLIEWGHEVGSRYIIYLQIEERRIVRRKRTSIPFLLSRYIVEGQVDGVYSLIDLNRSKVVGTWELKTRLTGPRQWQVAEDYPDDPNLHLSAPKKYKFMKKLEEKAAVEIINEIKLHLKGR